MPQKNASHAYAQDTLKSTLFLVYLEVFALNMLRSFFVLHVPVFPMLVPRLFHLKYSHVIFEAKAVRGWDYTMDGSRGRRELCGTRGF